MAVDIVERARRYVARMDAAVAGSNGHDATFQVACVLVHGFDLSEAVAFDILSGDYNPRCSPAWSEKELRHKVQSAQAAPQRQARGWLLKGASGSGGSVPVRRDDRSSGAAAAAVPKKQEIDEGLRKRYLLSELEMNQVDVAMRSPVPVQSIKRPEDFLRVLYPGDEKILIFTSFTSQGEFGFFAKDGGVFALGGRPGEAARRVDELPRTAAEGIWFLPQPVSGEWGPNGSKDKQGRPKLSRRSGANLLAWRYMLLEADDVDPMEWLRTIVQLPLPIAAMYSSGGRSLHALVRVDARSHAHFYSLSQKIGPLISKLGGDAAAISGVRLTRLPLCMREGSRGKDGRYVRYDEPRRQRLFYLNPNPEVCAVSAMPVLRTY